MDRHSYVALLRGCRKVEAAAKARGFTGDDGESWHDFVEAEHNKFRTAKQFSDLPTAEAWLKGEVAATKSVFGQGTIILQEPVTATMRGMRLRRLAGTSRIHRGRDRHR